MYLVYMSVRCNKPKSIYNTENKHLNLNNVKKLALINKDKKMRKTNFYLVSGDNNFKNNLKTMFSGFLIWCNFGTFNLCAL